MFLKILAIGDLVINKIRKWIAPELNRKGLLRLLMVIVVTYLFFGFLLIPASIDGISMEPTYRDGHWLFCWSLKYSFRKPQVGDIVMIKMAGASIMLLKRVVAVAGETVEFKKGKLYVNGKPFKEPYVKLPCDWDLKPRKVKLGHIYVIGDNRSMSIFQHKMGQTSLHRVKGGPLW